MPTRLTKLRGNADLSDWSLDSLEGVIESIGDKLRAHIAGDVFEAAVENESMVDFALFAREVAGSSPLVLCLTLFDIATNTGDLKNDKSLVYSFDLRDALQKELDECRSAGSYAKQLSEVSKALKQLASEIDSVVTTSRA